MFLRNCLPLLLLLFAFSTTAQRKPTGFVKELDQVRMALRIPGMSVAVLEQDNIIISRGLGYANIGRQIWVKLYEMYPFLNKIKEQKVDSNAIIAALIKEGTDRQDSVIFQLPGDSRIRIYGIGENCSTDGSSWCDYGWIEDLTGKTIWQMRYMREVP